MTEPTQSKDAQIRQVPACDRCTQGVMDATNPHMLGTCPCECHWHSLHATPTWALEARVDEWVQNG